MWIGQQEAQAIAIELQGLSTPRPLTHMLLKNILTNLQVKVERIVIQDLRDNTFFASIFLRVITSYSIHYTKLYELSRAQWHEWCLTQCEIECKVCSSGSDAKGIMSEALPHSLFL